MRRRQFVKGLSMGSSGILVGEKVLAENGRDEKFSYGQISTLEEAKTKEGLINVCLEMKSKDSSEEKSLKGNISVSKGKLVRIKKFSFEQGEDILDGQEFETSVSHKKVDIVALWIEGADVNTEITFESDSVQGSFTLQGIVNHQKQVLVLNGVQITANFLLDREIGEIQAADFNAVEPGDKFRLAVMADPQGGDPEEQGNHPTRMKIHNAWLEESVRQTNIVEPHATLFLGDIVDGQGQEKNFIQMADYFKKLESPILYAIGNHETKYKSVFTPGYNMEAFNNYFDAQKKLNGLELMLYSFNLGKWHFVVWPDPLRDNFWETHPHYFDWLERDLEKYKNRPTIFFQHVPSHPIGINPLINYAESVDVKRTLLNILSNHGNVKYIFSGHVHIPVKASFKTAVTFNGIKMINLPPAGYRPRAFGEEDYHGGPCQGLLVLDFEGEECKATYRTVMEEEYEYPEELPEFNQDRFPLWLKHKWELPASGWIKNGDFSKNLDSWCRRYVYQEDENPSNICESRIADGKSALYLYSRKRGFDIPGQDRLPQTINRICQAISIDEEQHPTLNFKYKIDNISDLDGWCGSYVWLEGFRGSMKRLNLIYSTGTAYAGLGGKYNQSEFTKNIHLGLDDVAGEWVEVSLNISKDHEEHFGTRFQDLDLDRLVINLGIWTINDGHDFPYGIYFTDFLIKDKVDAHSIVQGKKILAKPDEKVWWLGKYFPFSHVAGDHRYIMGTKKMEAKK